jgi:hypothetical protein
MIEDRLERPESWQADQAPRERPLSYPGAWPQESILLAEDRHFPLDFPVGRRLGQARVVLQGRELPGDPDGTATEVPLNYALLRFNVASVNNRVPVLAVGSNASPAQMRHKFGRSGVSLVIPMVRAEVRGLSVGLAPAVAQAGYIPATPIVGPDLASSLFVQWLDARQLAALDATETSYTRVRLSPGSPDDAGVRITLPSGEVMSACYAYVADRGVLTHDGSPRLLEKQADLLTGLLAASERLRDLLGHTAHDWIERVRDPGVIQAVREIMGEEGWTGRQPALDRLVAAQTPLTPPLHYGQILPAAPLSGQGWIAVPSADQIDRCGQACVRVAPSVAETLGHPELVAVRPSLADQHPDVDRLEALARLIVDDTPDDSRPGTVEVDQIVRDALGVEVGEEVSLAAADVHRRRWHDVPVGPPLYVTCRVQSAELATIEREVCLLDALALELLGVEGGAEVVIEGSVADNGVVRQVRVKAFAATEAIREQRERVHGGGLDTRYPSARDALGVHPDLTWIYLDSSTRGLLGTQDLGTVRVRASRSFQLRHELREMLLVLSIAFLGLVELVTTTWARLVAIVVMVLLVVLAVSVRMRGRLTHRVVRSKDDG